MSKILILFFFFFITTSLFLGVSKTGAKTSPLSDNPAMSGTDLKSIKAREFFEKGNQYAERGLADKAKEFWRIALDLDPNFAAAAEKLNLSISSPSSIPETKKLVNGSGDLARNRFSDLLKNAQEAYDHKNYPEALKYLDLADSLNPSNPLANSLRSATNLENFKPDSDRPYNHLVKNFFEEAVENFRHKRYEEALQSLGQAENLDHNHPLVLDLKEQIQSLYSDTLLLKEVQRARDQKRDGNEEIALEILANVLEKNPRFQTALDLQGQLNGSIKNESKSKIQTQLEKAKNAEKNENFISAKTAYERVLKIDPSNLIASQGLERITTLIDPLQKKITDLESALRANQKNRAELNFREVEELSPRHPKLRSWKEKIAKINTRETTDDSQARADEAYNLGLESYRKGDLAGAKNFWTEALRLDPRYTQARRNLDRLIEENPQLK